MQTDQLLAAARDVLLRESASVAALTDQLNESFVRVAQLMLECTGHVLVAGSGTSNAIALRFAHLLSCCGTPSLFIHPGDAQHGSAGAVTARDVLVAISKGGSTTEVNHLARIAKERGAKVIAFTEKPDSELGHMADAVLKIQAAVGVDPYGMIATGSSLTNAAMCDALCITLLHLRGYTEAAFSQTHPGGAVGHMIAQKKEADQ